MKTGVDNGLWFPVGGIHEISPYRFSCKSDHEQFEIVHLQREHFLDEVHLFVDEEATTVRLPRDDIRHSIGLELA
jgi:hypothetical protein